MLALHIALFALLGSSLVLSVVQLGLTAYVVTFWGGTRRQYSYSLSDGYSYRTIRASTPEILAFLVFVACWSILVTIAALVLPWFYTRKGTTTGKLNTILGIGFAVAYGVTMVFWLAGFGDLVAKLGGASSSDYVNAVIAFAVILWLLFVALFTLSVLALCGVLVAEWPGYQSLRKNHEATAPRATNAPVTNAPAHDVPMSTTPVAPSELSTHDAEALHNQPHSQPHSTSSPSAIASVELSGDSVPREHHTGRP